MELKMSKHWPDFMVLCIVFLFSLNNGTLGSINPGNLKKIIKYITDPQFSCWGNCGVGQFARPAGRAYLVHAYDLTAKIKELDHVNVVVELLATGNDDGMSYGIENSHYAVAVRLDSKVCKDPSAANLKAALPKSVMDKVHEAINKRNGIYDPSPIGNVVAARPNFKPKDYEHAEWRLLTGGQNSPTAKILENKLHDSCLIFFSRLSPCINRCLNLKDVRNFVQWLVPLFNQLDKDSRAFVFETFYGKDSDKEPAIVVAAWKTIKHAPLFRCNDDNEDCIPCFDNNDKVDPRCLAKQW